MAVRGTPDKFIYITGCDTGFGSILTRKLDALGFSVISGVYLSQSVASISSSCSKNVHPIQVDVASESSVLAAAKQIESIIKKSSPNAVLYGIVNNAGILVQPGPTEWTPFDAYRNMFNVNIMGTVMTTKSLLPLIRKSQGRIINVASIAGRVGFPTEPAYCMSKYGVQGYSEVLRKDMMPWNVSVHIIEPGIFSKTGLYDKFQTGLDKLWEDLDPKIKEDYGEDFYKSVREGMGAALKDQGNTNSDLVPEAMVHALTSEKPKYRYRVGTDSKYLISIIEKCHESTQDRIMTMGNPKVKSYAPKAAPANGKQMVLKRYDQNWTRFGIIVLVLVLIVRRLRG